MFIILGCLENFSIKWRTGSVWDVPEIRSGFQEMFKHFATLLKNSWKILATFLSFEMIFSFSISVILSLDLILLAKRGATFHLVPFFWKILLNLRLLHGSMSKLNACKIKEKFSQVPTLKIIILKQLKFVDLYRSLLKIDHSFVVILSYQCKIYPVLFYFFYKGLSNLSNSFSWIKPVHLALTGSPVPLQGIGPNFPVWQ